MDVRYRYESFLLEYASVCIPFFDEFGPHLRRKILPQIVSKMRHAGVNDFMYDIQRLRSYVDIFPAKIKIYRDAT